MKWINCRAENESNIYWAVARVIRRAERGPAKRTWFDLLGQQTFFQKLPFICRKTRHNMSKREEPHEKCEGAGSKRTGMRGKPLAWKVSVPLSLWGLDGSITPPPVTDTVTDGETLSCVKYSNQAIFFFFLNSPLPLIYPRFKMYISQAVYRQSHKPRGSSQPWFHANGWRTRLGYKFRGAPPHSVRLNFAHLFRRRHRMMGAFLFPPACRVGSNYNTWSRAIAHVSRWEQRLNKYSSTSNLHMPGIFFFPITF